MKNLEFIFLVVRFAKDIMLRLSVRGLGVAYYGDIVATEVGGVAGIWALSEN